MSVREGLRVRHRDAQRLPAAGRPGRGDARGHPDLHVLRDPTRGGVATSLNEIARASGVGVEPRRARRCPIPEVVANACAFLGLDPLQVANEGKLLAFVPPRARPRRCWPRCGPTRPAPAPRSSASASRSTPAWSSARTGFGAARVVDLPIGEQLPADLLSHEVPGAVAASSRRCCRTRWCGRSPGCRSTAQRLEQQGKVLMRLPRGRGPRRGVDLRGRLARGVRAAAGDGARSSTSRRYTVHPLADMTGAGR